MSPVRVYVQLIVGTARNVHRYKRWQHLSTKFFETTHVTPVMVDDQIIVGTARKVIRNRNDNT